MPVPTMAPMPSATRCGQPRVGLSPLPSTWPISRSMAMRCVRKLISPSPRIRRRDHGPLRAGSPSPGLRAAARGASLALAKEGMSPMLRGTILAAAVAATLGLSGAQAREGETVAVAIPAPPARSPLDALVADYEAWNAGQDPISAGANGDAEARRSEEHTSELQSQSNLVFR